MKKLLFTTAVMLMTAFGSAANAELALVTTNGGSFNYDPSNSMETSLNVGSTVEDRGLSDFAIFLGYRNTSNNSFEDAIELTNGTVTSGGGGTDNRGTVQFDPVTFDNGVTVSTLATFRLADTTGAIGNPSASLLYDLELTTSGVPANPGALLSLASFDFNNNGLSDRNQPNETISGFGQSQVAIGDVNAPTERVLSGSFNFADFQDNGRLINANNLRDDQFNIDVANGETLADNLNSLEGFAPPTFTSSLGNLGLAAFSDFAEQSNNQTFVTAGAVGFRSTAASNATIPEPSTLMMASLGLGMVAFRRRKRA